MIEERAAEHDLIDRREAGTIHVHRCAHRTYDRGDLPRHVHVVAGTELEWQRGGGRTGTERGQGRYEDFLKEMLYAPPSGSYERIEAEEDEEVRKHRRIVDEQSATIGGEQLRAVGTGQVCEIAGEADRCELHEDVDHLVEDRGHVREPLGNGTALLTEGRHGHAEEHGKYDQWQDVRTGDDIREVTDGEGVDNLITDRLLCALDGGTGRLDRDAGVRLEDRRHDEHDGTRDRSGDDEDRDRHDQKLSDTTRIPDGGDGARNRKENQRHQKHEEHVQPDLTDRI